MVQRLDCALVSGNFFFAGARLFFRSLEAGIFLFSRVARIPEGSLVLPVIRTEEKITLGAELLDGSIIRGQNEISHPSAGLHFGPSACTCIAVHRQKLPVLPTCQHAVGDTCELRKVQCTEQVI